MNKMKKIINKNATINKTNPIMSHFQPFIKFKTLILFSVFMLLCKFSYGSSSVREMPTDSVLKPKNVVLPKFRLGAQIGYAYRLLPAEKYFFSPVEKRYHSKLKSSLCYGVDLTYYFFGKCIGVGLKYNGIYTQAKLSELYERPDGDGGIGAISEKIGVHYLGPFLAARFFVKSNKHLLFVNAGAGLAIYRNNAKLLYLNAQNTITIKTPVAFSAEIGYDFFVTKSLVIGLQLSTVVGLKREDVNVDHLGLTLGVRYWK